VPPNRPRPAVTVVMPVYNRAAWVPRALESVLAQTWSDFEVLVVDDGSTDGTADILRRYHSYITLLSSSHAGAYAARNLALHQSRGALVAFIDSDDVWHPDRLECQRPLLEDPEVGLVFGDARLVDYRRDAARRLRRTFFDGVSPFRGRGGAGFTRGNCIPFSSVLVRRECFETCGDFAPVRMGADYLKWFEIAHRHQLDYVPRPVCDYAIHSGSLTYDSAAAIGARLALFSDALASASDPGTRIELQRIVLIHRWHFAVARLRAGSLPRLGAGGRVTDVPPATRFSWWLGFLGRGVSRRLRRLMIETGVTSRSVGSRVH
jgi:glycosyltransferase involved in cell wall biosynthesis